MPRRKELELHINWICDSRFPWHTLTQLCYPMLIVYFSPAVSLNYVNLFMMIKSNNNSHQKPQFHSSDQSWSQVPVILLPETAVHFSSPAIHSCSPHSPHLLFTDSYTRERASKFIAGKQDIWQSLKSESFNNQMPAGVRNWKSFVGNSTVLQIHTHTCKTHKQGKTGLRQRGWSGEKGRNREVSKVRMGIMTCL